MAVPLRLEQRVDERRKSRALAQNDEKGGEQHYQDNRQHPPALVPSEKGEEFSRDANPA